MILARRFSRLPAIAIGIPEEDWGLEDYDERLAATLQAQFGDWILEEDADLGQPEAVAGSTGRGAAGLAAVVEWVAVHAAGGVVSAAAAMAFKRVVSKARDALKGRERPRLHVSRGGAAYLAAADVADRFDARGPFIVEAVEEPSSIAGHDVSELSYVGIEPWVVLLRSNEDKQRYISVVEGGGEILGALAIPLGEWEEMFLPPAEDSAWAQPPPTTPPLVARRAVLKQELSPPPLRGHRRRTQLGADRQSA
jgi:hypothetical protein